MKQEIIKLIEEQLNASLANLENYSEGLRTAADLDEEETRELDDYSQQAEDRDMEARMKQQALMVGESINWLNAHAATTSEIVEPGALVETNDTWLYFGIPLPNMEIKGKKLVGVSEDAPAFAEMQGKKKGDKIMLGDQKLTIEAIY